MREEGGMQGRLEGGTGWNWEGRKRIREKNEREHERVKARVRGRVGGRGGGREGGRGGRREGGEGDVSQMPAFHTSGEGTS